MNTNNQFTILADQTARVGYWCSFIFFFSSSSLFPPTDGMVLRTSAICLVVIWGRVVILLLVLKSKWKLELKFKNSLSLLFLTSPQSEESQESISRNDFALTGTIMTKLVGCLIQLVATKTHQNKDKKGRKVFGSRTKGVIHKIILTRLLDNG